MKCPFCNNPETIVKDSRANTEQTQIRRRRECLVCFKRYSTLEKVQIKNVMVIKRSGIRKNFDRDKIFRSIITALRKRHIDNDVAEDITDKIVATIELSNMKEISTNQIGKMIMGSLEKIDPVAYIRFASVYKDFNSVEDFVHFIGQMNKKSISFK
jgi:transcriptional repressor NrdR